MHNIIKSLSNNNNEAICEDFFHSMRKRRRRIPEGVCREALTK